MSMILSWVLFPLVLAALGLGWGALIEWGAGGLVFWAVSDVDTADLQGFQRAFAGQVR